MDNISAFADSFNPVLPVSFSRDIWKVIDIAAMLIFLLSGYLVYNNIRIDNLRTAKKYKN